MQVMLEWAPCKKLSDRIKINDAYLDGERTDGKLGIGANKIPFVEAQTDQAGHLQKVKAQIVDGFRKKRFQAWAESSIEST